MDLLHWSMRHAVHVLLPVVTHLTGAWHWEGRRPQVKMVCPSPTDCSNPNEVLSQVRQPAGKAITCSRSDKLLGTPGQTRAFLANLAIILPRSQILHRCSIFDKYEALTLSPLSLSCFTIGLLVLEEASLTNVRGEP